MSIFRMSLYSDEIYRKVSVLFIYFYLVIIEKTGSESGTQSLEAWSDAEV